MNAKKVLNNNVIITKDDSNKEIIVMGKGLAFGLKAGDTIDETRIDKVFSLKTPQETTNFSELLSQVPLECFTMTEDYVNYATEKLGKKLHSSIYITLTDHINSMFERAKVHAYIKNMMLWDIKRLYSDEFKVSKKIIEMFNQTVGSAYDDNEAATITLHIVNSEMELDFSSTVNVTKVITEILNIVKYHFRITYNEDSLSYYRFITHLRFFAQRLFTDSSYDDTSDVEFLKHIHSKYEEEYQCTKTIKKFVFDSYQYSFTDEECIYLTVHIAKVVKDSNRV